MRPWAQWTAKTALLAAGFAALDTIGVGVGAVAVARRRRNSEVYVEPACRPKAAERHRARLPLSPIPRGSRARAPIDKVQRSGHLEALRTELP